ncbi:MAG TPA: lipoyl(octanoyl) transferase LipB [Terriglobales bacterium]|nr:lipoyl(octanoyl) transferase LipB [Terriglobales bacterium]
MTLVVRDIGLCPYDKALALQHELVERKLAGDRDDYLLLLEHPSVYTLGRGADDADLQQADRRLGIPAHRTGRGGGVTYHGPGQVIAYPILALQGTNRDVRGYVRRLEQVIIDACSALGVSAERIQGSPGVFAGGAKLASIGIGIRRWVTFHGLALNVSTDMSFFRAIVPCREPELRLTSLAQLLDPLPSDASVKAALVGAFEDHFVAPIALAEAS